jgi:hypothetical protein
MGDVNEQLIVDLPSKDEKFMEWIWQKVHQGNCMTLVPVYDDQDPDLVVGISAVALSGVGLYPVSSTSLMWENSVYKERLEQAFGDLGLSGSSED